MAQVLVQNRVSLALPVIPALVQNEGINVKKMSPNTLMIVNLISPDKQLRRHFPEQLRHDLRQRRTGPRARRGRHHLSRPARLQLARLARSRQTGGAQPDRQRRGQRHRPAKYPSRRRTDRPATRAAGAAISVDDQHAGPADRSRSNSPTSSSRRPGRAGRWQRPASHSTGQSSAGGVSGSTAAASAGTTRRGHFAVDRHRAAARCGHASAADGKPRVELGLAAIRAIVHARRPAVGRAFDLSTARLQRAGNCRPMCTPRCRS